MLSKVKSVLFSEVDLSSSINQWQKDLLACMGVTEYTDKKQIQDACRRILLSTSALYDELDR